MVITACVSWTTARLAIAFLIIDALINRTWMATLERLPRATHQPLTDAQAQMDRRAGPVLQGALGRLLRRRYRPDDLRELPRRTDHPALDVV